MDTARWLPWNAVMLCRRRLALKREAHAVKAKARTATKQDRKEVKRTRTRMEKALRLSEGEELDATGRAKVAELIDQARASTSRIQSRCKELLRFDDALRREDWDWLRKTHNVNVHRLTPEQQDLIRQNCGTERKRLEVETVLQSLEKEVAAHVERMQHYLDTAKSNAAENDPLAASGWIIEALKEDKTAQELEEKILAWERCLLKLIRGQERKLAHAG